MVRDRTLALSEAHIKGIMQQALAGVDYLHGLRMLHRDLKVRRGGRAGR